MVIIITSVAILARVVDQEAYILKVKRDSQDISHSFDTLRAVNAIDWTICSENQFAVQRVLNTIFCSFEKF